MSRDTPVPYLCIGWPETWSSTRFFNALYIKYILCRNQYQLYVSLNWVFFLAPVRWAKTIFGIKSREIKFWWPGDFSWPCLAELYPNPLRKYK